MDKIYYISQGATQEEQLQNIKNVCKAGGKLVQLRVKDISFEEHISIAKKAKEVCDHFGAKLIINDDVQIAKEIEAAGVHVGKNDIAPTEARKIVGPKYIVGGTANTYEDCIALIAQKVTYIGLGPFRFTETKKNLSPVLGFSGFHEIVSRLAHEGHKVPIYAIGGITENDFEELYEIGVFGIAISGLISNTSIARIEEITQYAKEVASLVNN